MTESDESERASLAFVIPKSSNVDPQMVQNLTYLRSTNTLDRQVQAAKLVV